MVLLTKKEAREKICPISFAAARPAYCRSDECMAWRERVIGEYGEHGYYKRETKGFCGLADEPK